MRGGGTIQIWIDLFSVCVCVSLSLSLYFIWHFFAPFHRPENPGWSTAPFESNNERESKASNTLHPSPSGLLYFLVAAKTNLPRPLQNCDAKIPGLQTAAQGLGTRALSRSSERWDM